MKAFALLAIICFCYFSFLYVVTYKIILCNWNIKLNDWFICKVKNRSNFYLQIPLVGIHGLSDILLSFFGRPAYEVFYKITLMCLSVRQFDIFLRNCSLFFWYSNICSKIFVSSASEIFMKNFRTAIFLNIEREFCALHISGRNGKTQNKDLFLWNKALISFQLKVYPLFHWS